MHYINLIMSHVVVFLYFYYFQIKFDLQNSNHKTIILRDIFSLENILESPFSQITLKRCLRPRR